MSIMITEDGVKQVASYKSYIGNDADESINEIKDQRKYVKVADCIGTVGYRNVTLMCEGWRLEIVCKTDEADKVLNESLAPSEVEWHIIDIFEYEERPKLGKGWYCRIE